MRFDWWTLTLQTVNVLILIWILSRFFFRPVANIVTKRQEEIGKQLADAVAERKAAAEEHAQAEKAQAEASAAHERLLVESQKAAQSEKTKLLAQASQEIARLRQDSEAMIARDRAASEQQIIDHASALAVDIARRLLERLPPNLARGTFLAALSRAIGELTPEARDGFTSAATTNRPVEVVTARPLSDSDTDHIREALNKAFGQELPLTFRSDPKLLAGIELHGHNVILRNSWRADLERIREDLSREQIGQS